MSSRDEGRLNSDDRPAPRTPPPMFGRPPMGGIGIPAQDVAEIFRRFHRGSNVTGRISGTGLGLAGAQQIVESHRGILSVESEPGYGSTFTVRLPSSIDPESTT